MTKLEEQEARWRNQYDTEDIDIEWLIARVKRLTETLESIKHYVEFFGNAHEKRILKETISEADQLK